MRTLALALFGILAYSTASAAMTDKEIIQEYNKIANKRGLQTAEPLNEADLVRKSHLVPLSEMFPNGMKHKPTEKLAPVKEGLPASVDLSGRDTSIKSQDDGKCTSYSGTAALENMMQRNGKINGLDLSEWHAWSYYQQYSTAAFVRALSQNYICDEKYFPQYGSISPVCTSTKYVRLAGVNYIGDNVDAMKAALARGNVVNIAMVTPAEMLKCKKVISPNSAPSDGGHALLISRYLTSGTETLAVVKNSWGSSCGDGGYQAVPMSICKKQGYYCDMYEYTAVEVKTAPTPDPVCVKWQRVWYAPWKKVCKLWQ